MNIGSDIRKELKTIKRNTGCPITEMYMKQKKIAEYYSKNRMVLVKNEKSLVKRYKFLLNFSDNSPFSVNTILLTLVGGIIVNLIMGLIVDDNGLFLPLINAAKDPHNISVWQNTDTISMRVLIVLMYALLFLLAYLVVYAVLFGSLIAIKSIIYVNINEEKVVAFEIAEIEKVFDQIEKEVKIMKMCDEKQNMNNNYNFYKIAVEFLILFSISVYIISTWCNQFPYFEIIKVAILVICACRIVTYAKYAFKAANKWWCEKN